MYSKDMLTGIILSSFVLEIRINKDKKLAIGYRTTVSLVARGNIDWLNAIKRSLLQHGITSKLNVKESKNRPSPLLRISSIKNLTKVKTLLKDFENVIKKCNQIKYFYGVNRITIENDEELIEKLNRITSLNSEDTSVSYGVYTTDLEVGFSMALKSSSEIQIEE